MVILQNPPTSSCGSLLYYSPYTVLIIWNKPLTVWGKSLTPWEYTAPAREKEPLKSDAEYEVILVDTTKTPVEHPKMGRNAGIPGSKSGIR
jgi:hypothetical protein